MAKGKRQRTALVQLIWPLAQRHRGQLAVVLLLMPLASVMAMLIPYLTKVAIDDYIVPAAEHGNLALVYEPLLGLVALSVAVVVVGYLADAGYTILLQRVGQRVIAELRRRVYQRSLRLPRRYFDDHPIGSILTRVTSDMEALGEGLATGVLSLFLDTLKTLAFLAMMFALNWRLTLVLLLLGPILAVLTWWFQRQVRTAFFRSRSALSEATGYLQEVLGGMKTIQLYGAEQRVIRRFEEKNHRYLQAQNISNFYDALLFSLVEGISTLALALMLWYAGGQLLEGLLTLGVLVAFMEYIQRLFVPIREFTQQLAVMQRALAALDHINQLMCEPLDPAETQAGDLVDEPLMSVVFENVRFRYREHEPEVLKGISFRLNRGQTLAIVGATGSGKSTVIRLITRAYGGYQGSIRINGRELREIPAEQLGRWISVVHQGVFLFGGSVAFNIALGRAVGHETLQRIAQYVHADRFIQRLPGGLQAPINQGGINLSAGQGQLLSLARALLAGSDLIVMDEATSSVDSITEGLIQDAVEKIYRDRTVIAIAHRLSTIRSADIIIVMHQGNIVESGTHRQLLTQGGHYAELVGTLEMIAE